MHNKLKALKDETMRFYYMLRRRIENPSTSDDDRESDRMKQHIVLSVRWFVKQCIECVDMGLTYKSIDKMKRVVCLLQSSEEGRALIDEHTVTEDDWTTTGYGVTAENFVAASEYLVSVLRSLDIQPSPIERKKPEKPDAPKVDVDPALVDKIIRLHNLAAHVETELRRALQRFQTDKPARRRLAAAKETVNNLKQFAEYMQGAYTRGWQFVAFRAISPLGRWLTHNDDGRRLINRCKFNNTNDCFGWCIYQENYADAVEYLTHSLQAFCNTHYSKEEVA